MTLRPTFGAFVWTLLAPCAAFAQGSLNPPGPPSPTMKTLDQVEARVPIEATRLTSDNNANFIIDQPGSYYLTGNLEVTKLQGIRVARRASGPTAAAAGSTGVTVRDNIGTGILADPNDVVVRNTAGANSAANYNPASGTNFGFIQAPSSSNNPMANVVF